MAWFLRGLTRDLGGDFAPLAPSLKDVFPTLVSFSDRFFLESHYNFRGPSVFLPFEFLPPYKILKTVFYKCIGTKMNISQVDCFPFLLFKRNENVFVGS